MSFDINLPKITAKTESGKIEQIRGYLFQLAEQLKWALNSIESGGSNTLVKTSGSTSVEASEAEAQSTFNSIKSLIIKSADIIDVYSEEISKKLSGSYVAKSDFGTYLESTQQTININSQANESIFNAIAEIISDIEGIEHKLINVTAHIRSGRLKTDDKGVPIYGLEIGQVNTIDGIEVFNKYAQFTSDRLSFFDKNDTEIAYISDYKLYITNAQVTGTLTLGRYELDTSDGLAFKWV